MNNKIILSTLAHTWILDLDGTIVRHNGYKIYGKDEFLNGAMDFLKKLPDKDMIIFLTSRKEKYREMTERFLKENQIRYDYIIFEVPYGERILMNDNKESGLAMSIGICTKRDEWVEIEIFQDDRI